MGKEVKVDNHSFNVDHYKNVSEQDFINAELASVPDNIGTTDQKRQFLKGAHAAIKEAAFSSQGNGSETKADDTDE